MVRCNLIVCLFLLAGCAGRAREAEPSSTAAAQTPTATMAKAALEELFKAMRAATQAKSFRAKIEAVVDERENSFDLEFRAPDRYRVLGVGFEFIVIGKDGYLRVEQQSWQKAPKDAADDANSFMVGNTPVFWDDSVVARFKPAVTLKSVSNTTVAGEAMKLFEYLTKDALGHKGGSTARTWVALSDGLPRRTELTSEYDGIKARATMTWQTYNLELKIEPPVLK